MVRLILFLNYTEQVKNAHSEEESLTFLQKSVETMNVNIDGLIHDEIGKNIAEGDDLVFYAEFESKEALENFKNHPLHAAHKERCMDIVTERRCGDMEC